MAGLSLEDLLAVARRAAGADVRVRDLGLLSAALARVEARALGRDVYAGVEERAAALLHSLATTAPLVRGNRPFAWLATAVYLARNERPSSLTEEQAVALVTDVLTGRVESVESIADRLGAPA
ncbi:type II toxin-antitoxin system death-on-curing family toxin [Blastococcus brunescens]|uniref:Type II toxin-antitoxin system death-on-curing family toxin n=1 Tax=Blastococcus brunescens TaxID=1564165 RepID=A0ABZ1B1Y5_9ACTN|nr:type II toxin-antitoxin system death-on-curing family toxin [Blastococcus sp. BMG 8361]WRL63888.1 type II toxin-antitoxin system death-on-curing family toxin [Blastococcus sp. BMG 8361]